ncbi:MAG: hypothetical protein D6725_12105 [Planctomycetota bacterium]|nr:MAG: hypothetical protein D6725_12105 [Planctomycetota bacterium]
MASDVNAAPWCRAAVVFARVETETTIAPVAGSPEAAHHGSVCHAHSPLSRSGTMEPPAEDRKRQRLHAVVCIGLDCRSERCGVRVVQLRFSARLPCRETKTPARQNRAGALTVGELGDGLPAVCGDLP